MNTLTLTERYNLLTDVEPASDLFMSLDKQAILQALSEVICRFGLQDRVGIRLLHRHHALAAGEIMLESVETDPGSEHCWITMPTRLNQFSVPFGPNSWMVGDDAFIPMEFSNDPSVAQMADFYTEQPDFFDDFRSVLVLFNVSGLLGPCLLQRNGLHSLKPASRGVLVETTDHLKRASVLRWIPEGGYNWKNMLETTWSISPALNLATDTGCVSVGGCMKFGEGNHTSVSGHQQD